MKGRSKAFLLIFSKTLLVFFKMFPILVDLRYNSSVSFSVSIFFLVFEFLLLSFCLGLGFGIFGLVWRYGLCFQDLCLGLLSLLVSVCFWV